MTAPARNTDLAQIHLAAKALQMDKPNYRAMLSERYGVDTAAALGPVQRQDLLAEFERRGWKRGWGGKRRQAGAGQQLAARTKDSSQLAKIRALLADAGRPLEYGDALAQRLAKVDRLEFATPAQLGKVIAALEIDARRQLAKSVELPPPLLRLLRDRPDLDNRVRGMYAGSLRNPRNTPERSTAWVLDTLRGEAEKIAAKGRSGQRVAYRNDRQYARDKRAQESASPQLDREYMDALALIGLVDRVKLEAQP